MTFFDTVYRAVRVVTGLIVSFKSFACFPLLFFGGITIFRHYFALALSDHNRYTSSADNAHLRK
jgi:hypothetical protein